METIEILTVILLITASLLCFALIFFVYRLVKSMHSIEENVQSMTYKLGPLIQSTLVLSEQLTHITKEAESQLLITKSIVNDVRDRADKIFSAETKIRNGIEDAVMPVLNKINVVGNRIGAVGKGIQSFWKRYRQKQIKDHINI
ncbi:MAG: hypothetical protein R6W90_16350 [Ignavibacteriaceae bacterium]